ncbi:protein regulator of cytokinesis 1-like isoform X2 [Contarinia nasturtii]|nr:protein regulator of cytokinesis 1-like isoform X2 [Contarinia nasturtii]
MDIETISRTREEMNATTHEFLTELIPKLDNVFDKKRSLFYLESMSENLKLFYKDVFTELENKQNEVSKEIEELHIEALELKRKLNIDFEFNLDRSDKMPLMVYRDKLDMDLNEMREKYHEKMNKIENFMKTQHQLCLELNENIRELSVDPLASDSEIHEVENYLIELKSEKTRRLNEIECLQNEIHTLCNELGTDISDLFQPIPTMENINYLKTKRDDYQKKQTEVMRECEELLQKLEILWECLEAPFSIRSKFRNIAEQSKISSVSDLNRELKECKAARQENIKFFIEKLRSKLIEQWDKIYKSQEERENFEFLRSDTYTEDLLMLHQMELEECIKFYNENKNIFELFIARNQWWEKKKALEAKQNEPNRYNNRGGQLLKEEKERKQTDIEIPKIEKRIKALAEEYRRQNNRDFLINGSCVIQLMEQDWETYRDSKELQKSARKAVATPAKVGMTPKTPLRGQVTLKRMASTTNLGMTTGNLAKKRHLDIPSREVNRTASVQKVATAPSYMVRSHTKRNLLNQYNDENVSAFIKPSGKSIHQRRLVPTNNKQSTLVNRSANKILKKYRLSSNRRQSHCKGIVSDESLVNYDAFENNIKTSQISNSSVVEQRDHFKDDGMISKSTRNNNYPLKLLN